MSVLVTGGAGYIGSHTCVELLQQGYNIVVVDNLCNASQRSLEQVEHITGKKIKFYQVDLLDEKELETVFIQEKIDMVIHFAGLKAVGESVQKPFEYYHNNITGTLILLSLMKKYQVKQMVFSSSATVYGNPKAVPIYEDFPLSTTNPYGSTKLMIEMILKDLCVSDPEWSIAILRYFNPVGAHKSGLIGENPKGIPNNLLPYITQVAVGRLETLNVYGDDYDTIDGTGVRDYIHVVDLALGHIKAIEKVEVSKGILIYNLGTGKGYSVLQMIESFEKASGIKIAYTIAPRRAGDIPICYADTTKAKNELNWEATKDLNEMCEDAFRWQKNNPNGYE